MVSEVETVTRDGLQAWTFPQTCTAEDGKVFDEILMSRNVLSNIEKTCQRIGHTDSPSVQPMWK